MNCQEFFVVSESHMSTTWSKWSFFEFWTSETNFVGYLSHEFMAPFSLLRELLTNVNDELDSIPNLMLKKV
jgi:hypothetical protein